MPTNVMQPSFAAGELSPSLYGRTDLAKYRVGTATLRNFYVDYRGGASTRAGTRYVATSATPGTGLPPRLVRFQFSTSQAYVLEFGNFYVAFYKNAAPILSGGVPYTIVSPYAIGDVPLLKFTQSADVLTICHPSYPPMSLNRLADTNWTLTAIAFVPRTGVPTITTGRNMLSAGSAPGGQNTAYRYVVTAVDNTTGEESLPSAPMLVSNCATMSITTGESCFLQWTPIANAYVYRLYRQQEVPDGQPQIGEIYGLITAVNGTSYTDVNGLPDWTAAPPQIADPFANGVITAINVTNAGSGYSDRTVVNISSGSGMGFQGIALVSGGHVVSVTVTNGGFGYTNADVVVFSDPGDAAITGATITLVGQNYKDINYWISDPTGYGSTLQLIGAGAGITGATALGGHDYTNPRVEITSTTGSGAQVTLQTGAPAVGSGATGTFALNNPNNYPSCTAYFVQRQWFAASAAKPETVWASKVAAFSNFTAANPVQDSDAITATIASTQVNAVKCLIPMPSGLIAGTSGGAFLISGGGVGPGGIPAAVSPKDITAQPQASNGFSDLPPIPINFDVLFQQSKGSIIRDLSYNFYVNIYTGTDMTVLSNHLFTNRTIREWAYAEEPYKIVWCVRDDGILLSLTYVKDQDVYAWTRHDTDGLFQSVCTVSEPPVDATYFVVKRLLGGSWVYAIERMADRSLVDGNVALNIPANIENAWCVDCGLALPQPAPAANLSPGTGAGVVGNSVTFSADAAVFSGANVGSVIRANGGHATITACLSTGIVNATVTVPFATLPDDDATPLQAASGAWTMTQPVTMVGGLWHLNGKTVAILADGNVVASQTVEAGSVYLPHAASSVVVGLPFTCQLQTLNIDTGEGGPGGSIQGKLKKLGAVSVMVKDSRGIQAGRTPATVVPLKEWSSQVNLGGPLPLVTGIQRVVMDQLYEQNGRLWLTVEDPVPATVLAVVPELSVGG